MEEMGGMLRERRGSQEMDETNLWEWRKRGRRKRAQVIELDRQGEKGGKK